MNRLILLFYGAAFTAAVGCGDDVQRTRAKVTPATAPSDADALEYTHVITRDTYCYSTVPEEAETPQESEAANGKVARGTKVTVLQKVGAYVRVEMERGRKGYVEAAAVNELSDHVDRQHYIPKH